MNDLRSYLDTLGKTLERARPAPVRREVTAPAELHLELTFRCNMSCIMCNIRYLDRSSDELTLDELRTMIEGSSLLRDIGFVVLSGGEALLRDDIVDITRYLGGVFPKANILILSNFLDTAVIEERLDRMRHVIDMKRLSLGSSVDGIGPVHDRVRGRAGSFEALERTVRMLREQHPDLYFSLNFTLTPENADQMLPVYRWGAENRHHVSFQVMVQKQETRQFTWSDQVIRMVEEQIDAITRDICTAHGIETASLDGLLRNPGLLSLLLSFHYIGKYLRAPARYFPGCPCGERYAMLDPFGNLYFCPVHKRLVAGNVREVPFDEVWRSPAAGNIRDFFGKNTCHCWLTCTNGAMIGSALEQGVHG